MNKSRPKKLFKLHGTLIFEAHDLDNAFWRLAKHFQALYNDDNASRLSPEVGTDIRLDEVDDKEKRRPSYKWYVL